MSSTCSICGGQLQNKQLLAYCPACGKVVGLSKEKGALPYYPAYYYKRWLQKQLLGKSAPDRGLLYMETDLGMGKTAFFQHMAENGGARLNSRLELEGTVTLLCDCSGTLYHCSELVCGVISSFIRQLDSSQEPLRLLPETAKKAEKIASALNRTMLLLREQGSAERLLYVIDNADCGAKTKQLLMEYVPGPNLLEAGVYVLVTASAQSLEEHPGFSKRLIAMPFTAKLKLEQESFSHSMQVKKIISRRILSLNLKRRLTDGDMAIAHINKLVKNDYTKLQVANSLTRSERRVELSDLDDTTDLLQYFMELKRQELGELRFWQVVRLLLGLAVVNAPVPLELLLRAEDENMSRELAQDLGEFRCLLQGRQKDTHIYLSLKNYGISTFLRKTYRERLELMLQDMMSATVDTRKIETEPIEKQIFQLSHVYDAVSNYGSEQQKQALAEESFLLAAGKHTMAMMDSGKFSSEDMLAVLSEKIYYLMFLQSPGRDAWLAEAYLQREACHEKAGDYNGAVYDYAAVLRALGRKERQTPDDKLKIAEICKARANIYLRFGRVDGAMEDSTTAAGLMSELYAKKQLERPEILAELYLFRAGLGRRGNKRQYLDADYERAIHLLEELAGKGGSQEVDYRRKLSGVYLDRSGYYVEKNDYGTALKDCDRAILAIAELPGEIWSEQAAAAYGAKGNILLKQKEYTQALHQFSSSVKIRERLYQRNSASGLSLARAYGNRGAVYSLMDQDTEAMEDYGRAIRLRVELFDRSDATQAFGLARAYLNRGILYGKLGKTMEEISDYTHGVNLAAQNLTRTDRQGLELCAKLFRYRQSCYETIGNAQAAEEDQKNQKRLQVMLGQNTRPVPPRQSKKS